MEATWHKHSSPPLKPYGKAIQNTIPPLTHTAPPPHNRPAKPTKASGRYVTSHPNRYLMFRFIPLHNIDLTRLLLLVLIGFSYLIMCYNGVLLKSHEVWLDYKFLKFQNSILRNHVDWRNFQLFKICCDIRIWLLFKYDAETSFLKF